MKPKTIVEDTAVRGGNLIAFLSDGTERSFISHNGTVRLEANKLYYEFMLSPSTSENTERLKKALGYTCQRPQDAGWPVE